MRRRRCPEAERPCGSGVPIALISTATQSLAVPAPRSGPVWEPRSSRQGKPRFRESRLPARCIGAKNRRVSTPEAGSDPRQKEAAQSLSQFAARVLNQLSVSAWLPAAALVLAAALLFQLGSVLDSATEEQRVQQTTSGARGISSGAAAPTVTPSRAVTPSAQPTASVVATSSAAPEAATVPTPLPRPDQEGAVLQVTLSNVSDIGFGGVVLLVVLIVVMTMLTQSFAFEAIRVLEGYWGPFLPLEWLTDFCSLRFRWAAQYLIWRRGRLLDAAAVQVERKLRAKEAERLRAGDAPFFTDVRIGHLRRHILEEEQQGELDERTKRWVLETYQWRRDLKATTSRRLTNVETRLRDYPVATRALPTRLGNVIRHHEDNTGERDLVSFVQRVWSSLPFSLQVQHDEYRARLDLYCTMVFVFPVLAAIAAVRLHAYEQYAITAIAVSALLCWWTYRAAVASARAWGQALELIAAQVKQQRAEATAAAATRASAGAATDVPRPWWSRLVTCRRGATGQDQTRSIS